MMMRSVGVFCGGNEGGSPAYRDAARHLGATLARKGLHVVFAGAGVGTMRDLADAALDAGGQVIGVMPRILADREQAHRGLSQLLLVDSLQERRARTAELSDAFIALPGGLGTLDGILEMLTWSQLGIQRKPCGFLNVNRYYSKLMEFFDLALQEGFLLPEMRQRTFASDDAERLLALFQGSLIDSSP